MKTLKKLCWFVEKIFCKFIEFMTAVLSVIAFITIILPAVGILYGISKIDNFKTTIKHKKNL